VTKLLNTTLILLILSIFNYSYSQEKFTVSGYIKDASNGENLIGATIYIKEIETGSASNFYGFYSVTLEAGIYNFEFRYLGFNTENREIDLRQNERIDLELKLEGTELEEIVIVAKQEDENVSGIQMSTNKLDIQSIQKLPV